MALALESFSIREYAAKMRSVDLGKCWPFDGDGRERGRGGETGSSLPPLSFRKFRWWCDDLAIVRSTVEIAPQEPRTDGYCLPEEARQARSPAKGRQKTPKKRSIVELFAVAPQIGAVDEDDDGGDDGEEEQEDQEKDSEGKGEVQEERSGARERKRKERGTLGDEKKVMVRKKIWMMDRKNKKKRIKKLKVEICAAKKEKIRKPKMSYSVDMSHLLQGSVCKQQFGKTFVDGVDAQKKKPLTVKSTTSEYIYEDIQPPKFSSKSQEEVQRVLPVHGILKNQTRVTLTKKASITGDAQGGNLMKSCRELVKHVTFSGKDDILGNNTSCSSVELPQLQSLCKILSDVLAASSGTDEASRGEKLPTATEGDQVVNKDVPNNIEKAAMLSSQKKQLNDACNYPPVSLSNRSCAETPQNALAETVDLNNSIQACSDLNCSISHSGDPQIMNSTHKDVLNSETEVCAAESRFSGSTSSTFPIPVGSCVPRSDATDSQTIIRNLTTQPSTSCLAASVQANERQAQLSVERQMGIFSHIPEIQQNGHFSPEDSISNICSSMDNKTFGGSRLASDSMLICRDKCINEDFIGLPLNSQGELIKLNSSGRFGFSNSSKKQNIGLGSVHNYPLPYLFERKGIMDHGKLKGKFPGPLPCWKDELRWFPEQYYHAIEPVTSGLGITELQNFERMKVKNHESVRDKDQSAHHNQNMMKVSCYGCKEYNNTHGWMEREKFRAEGNLDHENRSPSQPTLRLMGKNVTLGKSNKECHGVNDGNIWTDKEIVTEQDPLVGLSDEPQAQNEWFMHTVSGTSKGNHIRSLEAASSSLYTPPIQSRFVHVPSQCRPQWVSNIGDNGSKVNNPSNAFPPNVCLNNTSKTIVHCNPATQSFEKGHQIPLLVSCPENVSQQMLRSSTHCTHSQSICYGTSTFHPPFTKHGPSSALSSSYIPQWLLNAKEQKKNPNVCSSSDSFATHLPCTISGTNLNFPSSYSASIVPFSIYDNNSCRPSTPAPLEHLSITPTLPASKLTSAVNANCRNKIKNRNGTKPRYMHVRGPNNASETNKRPADRRDEFMRPVKKPSLTVPGDSSALTEPRSREQLHGYIPYNSGTAELHGHGKKRMDLDTAVINNEKDGFRASFRSTSSKFEGGLRSGPVKLRAGAKHILKPSLNTDPDNPRPIHATIHFAVGTSSGNVLVPQKKATKVYRF